MNGQKEAREREPWCRRADGERRKKMNMPRKTLLCYLYRCLLSSPQEVKPEITCFFLPVISIPFLKINNYESGNTKRNMF